MRWNDALLDTVRRTGDPLADEVVRSALAKGEAAAVNQLLAHLVRNEGILPRPDDAALDPALGALLADYVARSGQLPAWADPDRIARGEAVFQRWGLQGFMLLLFASLPASYALRDVAAVLGITQRLIQHAHRRILETTQLALAVMARDGLAPRGHGVAVLQKVRLMHAAMRVLILRAPSTAPAAPPSSLADALAAHAWDPAHGCPIGQEALAAVLLTFSHVVLEGWRRLDIALDPDEADGYVHCWNVAGALLGIREELLPLGGAEEAAALYERLTARGVGPSAAAALLTERLLEFGRQLAPRPHALFRPLARPMGRTLMRQVLPEATLRAVALPPPSRRDERVRATVLQAMRVVNLFRGELIRKDPVARWLFGELSRIALRRLRRLSRGDGRASFAIPDSLVDSWKG